MAPYRDASYLVLGASGMLGSEVCAELDRRHLSYLKPARDRVDITVPGQLAYVMKHTKVAVINCAGAIPQRRYSIQRTVLVNGLSPHYIAKEADKAGLRVIHVSTDCVYGYGSDGPHTISDPPAPSDIYGRSKLLGEVDAPHVTNVRTSFIGPKHGLMRWAMDNKGQTVEGWVSALWSGGTVHEVASGLVQIAESDVGDLSDNIIHLSTYSPISKAAVLSLLSDSLNLDLIINPVTQPYIDRSLIPTVTLPPFQDCMEELIRCSQ